MSRSSTAGNEFAGFLPQPVGQSVLPFLLHLRPSPPPSSLWPDWQELTTIVLPATDHVAAILRSLSLWRCLSFLVSPSRHRDPPNGIPKREEKVEASCFLDFLEGFRFPRHFRDGFIGLLYEWEKYSTGNEEIQDEIWSLLIIQAERRNDSIVGRRRVSSRRPRSFDRNDNGRSIRPTPMECSNLRNPSNLDYLRDESFLYLEISLFPSRQQHVRSSS